MGKDDKLQEFVKGDVNQQLNIQKLDNDFETIDLVQNTFLADWQQAEQTYTGKMFEAEEYRQMARLEMGPDKQLGKFQTQSGWEKKNRKKLNEIRKKKAEEKEKFGAYSNMLMEDFRQSVESKDDYTDKPITGTADYLNKSLADLYQDGNGLQLFDLKKVQKTEQKEIEGLVKLNSMFQQLAKGVNLNPDESAQLMNDYQELVKQGFFKPGDMSPSAREMCDYLAKKGGSQCQIVLLDTIATSLFQRLDSIAAKQPEGFVNFENFKKFYGIKNLIQHAALKAMTSTEWVDYVTEEAKEKLQERELKRKQEEEARKALVMKRLDVIQNGIKSEEKNSDKSKWYIKDGLVDVVKQYFKTEYNDEIGSPDQKKFYRDIVRLNENIKTNLHIVQEIIKNKAEDVTFGVAKLQDQLEKILLDHLKEQMIQEHNEEADKQGELTRKDFEKNILEKIKNSKENFKQYQERFEYIHKIFPEISEGNLKKILQKDKGDYLFLEEEKLKEVARKDVLNYKVSVQVVTDKVNSTFSSYNRGKAEEYIKEKIGETLLSGSPALVGIYTDHTIRNFRYQDGKYTLEQSEKMFVKECKKYPREYWDVIGTTVRKMMDSLSAKEKAAAVGEEAVEQEKRLLSKCFARVKEVIQENDAAFTDLVADRSLPSSVWKKLFLAKAEHILSNTATLETALRKHLENIPERAETFTMAEYINGHKEPVAQEKKGGGGYHANRLLGEEFLGSPKFSGFLTQDDKEMIYEALTMVISDRKSELKSRKELNFLKGITTMEQLDTLTESDFRTLVEQLNVNLEAGIKRWAGYQGPYQEEVKRELIQQILVKKIGDEELNQAIQTVSTEKSEQIENAKKRVDLAFAGETPKHEKVNFVYLNVKANEKYAVIQGDEFKPTIRNKKFDFANLAWDHLWEKKKAPETMQYLDKLRKRVKEQYDNAKPALTSRDIVSKMLDLFREDLEKAKTCKKEMDRLKAENEKDRDETFNQIILLKAQGNDDAIKELAYDLEKRITRRKDHSSELEQVQFKWNREATPDTVCSIGEVFDQVEKETKKKREGNYFTSQIPVKWIQDLVKDLTMSNDAKIENYFLEFLLNGSDDVLFSHGCSGEEEFLRYEDVTDSNNGGYEGFLASQTEIIGHRFKDLGSRLISMNDKLKSQGKAELTEEQMREIVQRMRYFTANMEGGETNDTKITKEQKMRNLEKFGYGTYADLLDDVETRIINGTLTIGGQTEEEKKLAEKKQMLMTYEDGLYAPIADYLLKQTKFFNLMVKYDRNSFISYLDELKKTTGVAMEALKDYSVIARMDSIKKQFIMQNEDMIFSNKERGRMLTEKDWKHKFEQYMDTFYSTNVADRKSINERIGDTALGQLIYFFKEYYDIDTSDMINIMNKRDEQEELRAKLDFVIELNGGDLSVLYDTDIMAAKLEQVEANRNANNARVQKWLESRKVDVTPVIDKNTNKRNYTEEQYEELELRRYIQIKACTLTPQQFNKEFPAFEEEFKKQYEKKKSSKTDYQRLEDLNKAKLAIETEKQRGREADAEFDAKMSELRKIRCGSSPVIVAYGGHKGDVSKNDIETEQRCIELNQAQKYLQAKGIEIDPLVVSIVIERQLAENKLIQNNYEDFEVMPGNEDIEFVADHLIMLNEAYNMIRQDKSLSEADAKKRLVYYYIMRGVDKVDDEKLYRGKDNQSVVDRLNKRFAEKEAIVGQLKTQVKALKLDVSLENEYRDFMDAVSIVEFTESTDSLKKFVEARLIYFKSASKVHTEIENWFAVEENTKEFSKEEVVRLRMGLKDYFHAKVLNGGKELDDSQLEEIKKEMAELLADEAKRRFLYESESELGKVGSDDLKESERTAAKLGTRLDMQNLILSQNRRVIDALMLRTNNPRVKAYANLDEDQKKVFALALSLPDSMTAVESLGSAKLYGDESENQEIAKQLLLQLDHYVTEEEFDPKLDYRLIIYRIRKTDGSLNEDAFDTAMKLTQTMIAKKNQLKPKDYRLLGDGKRTISLAKQLKIGAPDQSEVFNATIRECNSMESFRKQIVALAKMDKEIGNHSSKKMENFREDKTAIFSDYEESIAQRVASLEEADLMKLVIILQNRGAIDFTTSVSFADEITVKATDYANPKLREILKDQLAEINNPDIFRYLAKNHPGKAELEKAMANLFSYQLRDDITIHPNEMKVSDFASNAFGRMTHVDWRLLKGALKLLDEINYESTKFYACRMARDNVENSYNEEARKKYAELNLKSEKIESFEKFDDIIMQCSREGEQEEDENVAACVAGFQTLSEDGKILFIKALQNRDILDISRKNLYASAIGKGERDYVNPKGRDDLIDEFIEKSTGDRTALMNNAEEFTNAMKSLLSTQIDDTRDFNKIKDYKQLEAGGKWYEFFEYKTKRNTAIDWKLFSRALAFVHRTLDERQMMLGNAELYRSMGDIEKNGSFQFDGKILRKNLHNSGNRFTRALARTSFRLGKKLIPGSDYINYALGLILSKEAKNAVVASGFLAEEEEEEEKEEGEKSLLNHIETGYDYVDAVLSDEYAVPMIIKAAGMEGIVDQVTTVTDPINIAKSAIESGKKIQDSLTHMYDTAQLADEFHNLFQAALAKKKEDEKRLENASKEQTEMERARAEEAFTKNVFLTGDVAVHLAGVTVSQDVVKDYSVIVEQCLTNEVTKKVVLGGDPVSGEVVEMVNTIMQEAYTAVRVIMQALKEEWMLRDYFTEKKAGEKNVTPPFAAEVKRRKKAISENSKLSAKQKEIIMKMDNIEFDRKVNGFEGFGEQASFVALKMVHTILFSASSQNPSLQCRLQGMGMLTLLGMKEDIGKQDFATCQKLYSKLMGAELR